MKSKITSIVAVLIAIYGIMMAGFSSSFPDVYSSSLSLHLNEEPKTLRIWYWDSSVEQVFEKFAEGRDHLQLEFTHVPNYEYASALSNAITTGAELPDICVLHGEFVSDYLPLSLWEDLSAPPYQVNADELPDWAQDRIFDGSGKLCALPCDVPASGIAYRAATMERIFGYRTRAEVEAAFPDWETLIEKASEAKDAGQDVCLFASLDDPATIMFNQTGTPYRSGNVLIGATRIRTMLSLLCTMRDHGLTDQISQCSPNWYGTFSDDHYLMAIWSDWLLQNGSFDRDPHQDWQVVRAPGGSYGYGASVCVIPKESKEKELAFEFLKYWLLSSGGADLQKTNAHFLVSSLLSDPRSTAKSMCLDSYQGQDIGKTVFDELLPDMQMRPAEPHAAAIQQAFLNAVSALAHDPTMDTDSAWLFFADEIKRLVPGTVIPQVETETETATESVMEIETKIETETESVTALHHG